MQWLNYFKLSAMSVSHLPSCYYEGPFEHYCFGTNSPRNSLRPSGILGEASCSQNRLWWVLSHRYALLVIKKLLELNVRLVVK